MLSKLNLELTYQFMFKFIFCRGSYKGKDLPDALNLETGMFQAPEGREYLVTLTAQMMNRPEVNREGGDLFSYGQLFVMKNGKLTSLDNYLLVEQGKVANSKMRVDLSVGDTLSVFVGYQTDTKFMYGPSGTIQAYDGFVLEAIRFCIF